MGFIVKMVENFLAKLDTSAIANHSFHKSALRALILQHKQTAAPIAPLVHILIKRQLLINAHPVPQGTIVRARAQHNQQYVQKEVSVQKILQAQHHAKKVKTVQKAQLPHKIVQQENSVMVAR